MILVGHSVRSCEESGCLRVTFRCTNREEFDLIQSKAIRPLPEGELVRVWTQLHPKPEPGRRWVIVHWEEL